MSSICNITTTTTIAFGEDFGGWMAGSPFLHFGRCHTYTLFCYECTSCCGLDSGSYAAAVATAVFFLFRIYPLYALHFMSLAVSNEAGIYLDSNVYMYWM
jgi:hypothetical protein